MTGRDLASNRPAYLLDRQFPENLIFGKAKFSMKNFQVRPFVGYNQMF